MELALTVALFRPENNAEPKLKTELNDPIPEEISSEDLAEVADRLSGEESGISMAELSDLTYVAFHFLNSNPS
jgi:hypothetical protein